MTWQMAKEANLFIFQVQFGIRNLHTVPLYYVSLKLYLYLRVYSRNVRHYATGTFGKFYV